MVDAELLGTHPLNAPDHSQPQEQSLALFHPHPQHSTHNQAQQRQQGQHQQQQQQEQQQQQQRQQRQQPYHQDSQGHGRRLENMTHEYLLQDMTTTTSTTIGPGPQSLLMNQPQPEAEEELNIYDYIHAKQEDEDEGEDHDVPPRFQSSTSTSTANDPSASSTTSNAAVGQENALDVGNSLGLGHGPDSAQGNGDYMDNSMDIYGSATSSVMPPYNDLMSPPTQDLFRMLMEELQTHAALQRERFFSATTGSDSGMDSVDFLFNGQQARPLPHFMMEMPSMLGDDSGSGLGQGTSQTLSSIPEPSSMQIDTTPVIQQEDVAMETAEPLGRMPSPHHSSGAITPETTSPSLQPCSTISAEASLTTGGAQGSVSPTSPKPEVVRVAFSRINHQTSKQIYKPILPHVSKPVSIAPKVSTPSPESSVTELSFRSVIENHNARRRGEGDKDDQIPAIITAQHSARKRQRLYQDLERNSPTSPEDRHALPSPPSSIKTTPPLAPLATENVSPIERIELPPISTLSVSVANQSTVAIATAPSAKHPATPTSPLPATSTSTTESRKRDLATAMGSDSAGSNAEGLLASEGSSIKAIAPNANNKRPWTTEEEKLLLKLVGENTPIKEIAHKLNRSVHSVRSRRQVLTDPGFVKGNGHAQPRRSKPDPSSKLPTYSQMAFLSLARLPEYQGTLNDVASMVEKLFSRYLNRIPRTGHKNLQIWRAQISDALAHEKGHPRPRFESFGIKRGRQWVYRLTEFGRGVMEAMGGVDTICEDLLKNNDMSSNASANDSDNPGSGSGSGAGAGLGHGHGYGYSYSPEGALKASSTSADSGKQIRTVCTCGHAAASSLLTPSSQASHVRTPSISKDPVDETSPESVAASNAIANAMAAMAAGLAAMTAVEDEKSAAAADAAAGSGLTSSSLVTIAGLDARTKVTSLPVRGGKKR